MKQILRIDIEKFLRKEGYKISTETCSEEEREIFDCWNKGGVQKIRLRVGIRIFQPSQLSTIFPDKNILEKFKSTLK